MTQLGNQEWQPASATGPSGHVVPTLLHRWLPIEVHTSWNIQNLTWSSLLSFVIELEPAGVNHGVCTIDTHWKRKQLQMQHAGPYSLLYFLHPP